MPPELELESYLDGDVPSIDVLPDELLLEIFQRLELHESHKKLNFRSITRVSRKWYGVANSSRDHLSIAGFKASKMAKILGRFTHLRSLNLGFLFDCSEEVLVLVGQNCPQLRELQVSDSYKHLQCGSGLLAVANGCSRLEVLSMHGYKGPDGPLMAIGAACRELRRLRLRSASAMSDAVLQRFVETCHKIEELDISFTDITDVALKAIGRGLPLLRQLDLKHCKRVSSEGIASVASGCLKLQAMHLSVVEVGDWGLTAIGRHSLQLEELYLEGGWGEWGLLSRAAVATLAAGCRALRLLSLRGSKQVDDDVLQGLMRGCPALTSLDLHACEHVGDTGLQAVIKGCKQLQSLVLSGTTVGSTGVATFSGGLPKLATLRLNGDLITDPVLQSIASSCKELEELYLANCGSVSDAGVEQLLSGCKRLKLFTAKSSPHLTGSGFCLSSPSLESLSLPSCGITDTGLTIIADNCSSLCHLSIPQCRQVSARSLVRAVGRCVQLRELIIVGCLQISRDEVLSIVKASRHLLKMMRVSRPDSPQDEYTIFRKHGGWNLPNWARSAHSSYR